MTPPHASIGSSRSLFGRILKESGVYSLALVAQRLAGLILMPITTRCISTAEYGILGVLEQTGFVLSVLLGMNFSTALGYFYAQADSEDARRSVVAAISHQLYGKRPSFMA